jgi:hypothetical protein
MDLDYYLEKVKDKESFLRFLNALKGDKVDENLKEKLNPSSPYDNGLNGWVNNSIDSYLDSIIAYTEDSNKIDEPLSWYKIALLFYMGKIYE